MSEQIDTALRWAVERIGGCTDSPRLDAELLLSHCLTKPRSHLYGWPEETLDEPVWQRFRQLVEARTRPTPIAYLIGEREFFSQTFTTTSAALVPRPETELTVETVLAILPDDETFRLLELGTGTGIIAITLKGLRPQLQVTATDIDSACVDLARANASRHGVEMKLIQSDWYRDLPADSRFDLIVSNPPYIAAGHPFLQQGDLPAEPQIALTPGASGLEALETIITQAPRFLSANGRVVVEHGYDQQEPVRKLFSASGFAEIECVMDYNDLPRVTKARLS